MTQLKLDDDSIATVKCMKDGRQAIVFHSIEKQMSMPVGVKVTLNLVQKLYNQLKGI